MITSQRPTRPCARTAAHAGGPLVEAGFLAAVTTNARADLTGAERAAIDAMPPWAQIAVFYPVAAAHYLGGAPELDLMRTIGLFTADVLTAANDVPDHEARAAALRALADDYCAYSRVVPVRHRA